MGSLLALALAAAVLPPPWPLSPDGELVAVRGEAPLRAERAAVEPVAPGLFRVVPAPGAGTVVLTAGDARVEVPVEPPPGAILITAEPPAPVKGRDAEVALVLTVVDAAGAPDPGAAAPVLVASSGQVSGIVADGPGRFRARYAPARARHPEVAVLFALSPRCPRCATPRAIGNLILPLTASIDLPGESEPGTRTTVVVAGKSFGPVVADDQGRFRVPVLVPPGASAFAISVDATGNGRRKELDLGLPEVDRIACAAWPRALPADGRSGAGVWCAASDRVGGPARRPEIRLGVSAGTIGEPQELHPGLLRADFRAPLNGPGEARLVATFPGGGAASRDELTIALGAGGPARIDVRLARESPAPGEEVACETAVLDARGALLGRPSGPPGATEGFVSPESFIARRDPGDWTQRARLAFALPPGEALATLSLRRRGVEWVAEARSHDGRPVPGLALRFGSGARATTDVRGEARVTAAGPAESVMADGGARAAGWEGIEPPAAPVDLAREVVVRLRPVSPVDVEARVEGRTLRWSVRDPSGPLGGRGVVLRASGLEVGTPERDGEGGKASLGPGKGTVAVVDAETGVAAVVEVR